MFLYLYSTISYDTYNISKYWREEKKKIYPFSTVYAFYTWQVVVLCTGPRIIN